MAEFEKDMLAQNQVWASEKQKEDEGFFDKLASGQQPPVYWIGCADSRVPVNTITGTEPGDIFVHRNIANMAVHTDLNMLGTLEYAVNVLKVKHVVVCGHYGCGGVATALGNTQVGMIDNWLIHIKDVYSKHRDELDAINDTDARNARAVELNVQEQLRSLAQTPIIQNAWKQGNSPVLHGWVFDLKTGKIKDLELDQDSADSLEPIYKF